MLDAGNPYVLPSAIVGAIAYLGVTALTDASLLVRLGLLLGIVGVVPIVLNRILGSASETDETTTTDETAASTGDDGDGAASDDQKLN